MTTTPGRRWAILAVALLAAFLVNVDEAAVPVATPRIGDALGASIADLQWIYAGFLLPLAALIVLGGTLCDRLGARRMLIAGLVLFAAGSAAAAAMPSPAPLIAMRVVEGIGAALVLPASLAVLRTAFTGPELPRALGFWVAGAIGGAACGPLIAGGLLAAFSWRSVFAPNVALGGLAIALALVALPVGARTRSPLRLGPNVALGTGLVSLAWGLVNAGSHGWGTVWVLPWVAAGAAVLGVLGARLWQKAHAASGVAAGPLAAGLVLTQLSLFAAVGPFFLVLIWFQRVQGLSPLEAGLYTLPLSGIAAGLSPLWGRVVARWGISLLLPVAFAFEVAGLAGLSGIRADWSYAEIVPYLCCLGIAMGGISTCCIHLIVGSVRPERGGAISGTHGAAVHVGNSLAVAVAGSVVATSVGGFFASALRRAGLPDDAATVHAATADLARGIAPPGPSRLPGLDAFSQAMGSVALISAVVAAVGLALALGVIVRHSRRHPAGSPATPQEATP